MIDRIIVTYGFVGEEPKSIADVIRVEQTIEFPYDLAPEWIQDQVVGKIEEISSSDKNNHLITILIQPIFPLYGAYRIGISSQLPLLITGLKWVNKSKLNLP